VLPGAEHATRETADQEAERSLFRIPVRNVIVTIATPPPAISKPGENPTLGTELDCTSSGPLSVRSYICPPRQQLSYRKSRCQPVNLHSNVQDGGENS